MNQNDELLQGSNSAAALQSEVTRLTTALREREHRITKLETEREIYNDIMDKLVEALKS